MGPIKVLILTISSWGLNIVKPLTLIYSVTRGCVLSKVHLENAKNVKIDERLSDELKLIMKIGLHVFIFALLIINVDYT